jgi:CRISPR-associated protein Cas2
MWVMVMFDLPTETKSQRKRASLFRKNLIKDGFNMFQFSAYLRYCPSIENAYVHIKRVKGHLPKEGKVGILSFTDKQWGRMEIFYKGSKSKIEVAPRQLEIF